MTAALATEVHESVGAVSAQLRLHVATSVAKELGLVALATLRHLERHGPRTVTELAQADRVTTQAISLRIGPLTERGLVSRQPDPRDARRTIVATTSRGRTLVADAEDHVRTVLAGALARLDPDERTSLRAAVPALLRLADALGQERA